MVHILRMFVFATSGAMAAVKHRLKVFGVLVLFFAAGNAGGVTRDLLIGMVPPAAIAETKAMLHILLPVLDLGGTFVFATSGAMVAIKHRLDVFGVLVLSFAAGNAGGITRDLLIGAVPPAAIADWKYPVVSVLAGLITFIWYPIADRFRNGVLWFDAVGLAFFAVAGAEKALVYGLGPMMAALLGMLTGIGGGMLRDVLVAEIPVVLRADFYALAALAGATVVVVGHVLHVSPIATTITGGVLCFALRFMAIRYDWHLPTAWPSRRQARESNMPDSGRDGRRS